MKYFFIFVTVLISGCNKPQSPNDIYMYFVQKEKEKVSYQEYIKYFSDERVKEVESLFPNYMKSMKKSKSEVIDFYLTFAQNIAKCSDLKLINENTSANTSTLIYSVTDTCNKPVTLSERTVKFTKKSGNWKIEYVVTKL